MRKCEQITLLYEASNLQGLSDQDREELEMHMDKCKKCSGYITDSKKLDLWLKQIFSKIDKSVQFSDEEKQKLKEKLR